LRKLSNAPPPHGSSYSCIHTMQLVLCWVPCIKLTGNYWWVVVKVATLNITLTHKQDQRICAAFCNFYISISIIYITKHPLIAMKRLKISRHRTHVTSRYLRNPSVLSTTVNYENGAYHTTSPQWSRTIGPLMATRGCLLFSKLLSGLLILDFNFF
jgi:uncharacterized membrane protein